MYIIRQDFQIQSAAYSADFNIPRSLGCHISHVLAYMDKRKYEEPADEAEAAAREARFLGGFLWEHLMAQQAIEQETRNPSRFTSHIVRIGELCWCYQCNEVIFGGRRKSRRHLIQEGHVGVFATPDGVMLPEWILKEWKFTTKSLKSCGGDEWIPLGATVPQAENPRYQHMEEGSWRWAWQTKLYCWLLKTRHAQLEACFVSGDYGLTTRDSVTPRFHIEFEQQELDHAWDVVVANALDGGMLLPEAA